MRTGWLIFLALVTALLQTALHGLGANVVIPNLPLVLIVWIAPRVSAARLSAIAVTMGIILESNSLLPFGTQLLGLLVFVLAAKLILQEETESRLGFQVALLVAATMISVAISAASLPFSDIAQFWTTILFQGALESLYNGIIIVLLAGLTNGRSRRGDQQRRYRLPA